MTALRPLLREWRIFYLTWANREINPTHPDVPEIVLRLRDLRAERKGAV